MSLPEELYDVFRVTQITRNTALEHAVAVDRVWVDPNSASETHRHNEAETVLYILQGSGIITVGQIGNPVQKGDRIVIPKGAWHHVLTFRSHLEFISIQCPPIHDDATGRHDLELEREKAEMLRSIF